MDATYTHARLLAPTQVLSRLRHPNIVRYYGACLEPPSPFIAEELMTTPLSTLIHGTTKVLHRDLLFCIQFAWMRSMGVCYM